ncbi:hypothetical protein B2G71_06015 [Novosphingobium sp. PC22D]|uniref:TorF family putative porin n=1 Tax=Novosphingobium sp. PC22D TaxID=1962403 RepID=UPI000BF1270C|nr:TorF family putative porin [Novosphingobium sp. PC22D]PEQ13857.1 hypothetical protein B2G71_06015 [Novosphingobium sp. PC22D]
MTKTILAAASALAVACLASVAAHAQTEVPGPITVSAEVALVSDYRFRGVSYTDEEMAIQGGIEIGHESGFYGGAWASNLSGWGTFAGANMELDLYAGYSTEISSGVSVDVGATYFMYPGGLDTTDFVEFYGSVSGSLGPAEVTLGMAYAPAQEALGKWYFDGAAAAAGVYDDPGDKEDNLYVYLDAGAAIPDTPISLNAHVGYSNGNDGLGPQGTSVAPTGEYLDWSIGADLALGPVTLGAKYIDTDISKSESAYLLPNFASTKNGSSIAGSTIVFSISAGF